MTRNPERTPAWTASRIARPVRDLARSKAFYRDVLGLPVTGGFENHDGYDGAFFALPEGGELELTSGPVEPGGGTDEDLLVLYLADFAEVTEFAARLSAADVPAVEATNPYWNRFGRTFLDPDGYRVVVAARRALSGEHEPALHITWHNGPRADLRQLFELAEDSAVALDEYLELGQVLVAGRGTTIVGHLQLVPTARAGEVELRNMAVLPEEQGTGIGRALVARAVEESRRQGSARILVATASADVGNLRFYQRVGFRMRNVERDAFTPATGYPDPIVIDGMPLRDRIWLDRELADDIPDVGRG